jgi:hypothetical protein
MDGESLRPETMIELQIHLDHLKQTAEQCSTGLRRVRGGQLTPDGYRKLLERQVDAQRAWEAKNRECFRAED